MQLTPSAMPAACCLLHWAVYKEKPICPQCKVPFSSLLTFRTVDGEVHDYPCQESVGMLKRAPWFQEHLKVGIGSSPGCTLR